uniref:Uncharacterized protein n=1 Tax=Plectus sambesii TaxID=2011161 RepID=A0A914X212_9BILA
MTNSVDVWSDDEGVGSPVSYRLAGLDRSVYDELETNSPSFTSSSPIENFWTDASGGSSSRRRQLPSLDRVKASSHRPLLATNSHPTLLESPSSTSARVLPDTPPTTRPLCLSLTSSSREAAARRGHMRSDASNYRALSRELQSSGSPDAHTMIDRASGHFLHPRDYQRLTAVSDDTLAPPQPHHRLIGPTRSADPSASRSDRSSSRSPNNAARGSSRKSSNHLTPSSYSMRNHQSGRSQSFKHRSPRRTNETRTFAQDDLGASQRRRSTPTVSRRSSFQQRAGKEQRTDVWPEPKTASEIEERFLKLPDSDDYTRIRQFNIDAKGAVVSRGDSFRRKRRTASGGSDSPPNGEVRTDSHSDSVSSQASLSKAPDSPTAVNAPDGFVGNNGDLLPGERPTAASTSRPLVFHIYVLGQSGTGKSALIRQFMTSEHKNPFAIDYDGEFENTVSVSISGQETELAFFESNSDEDETWIERQVSAYLLVYSVDSKSSFRNVMGLVEDLRHDQRTRHKPIIVAGNKIDLERRRCVTLAEAQSAAAMHNFIHFEVSVALNHDVDEVLIGVLAEIRESLGPRQLSETSNNNSEHKSLSRSGSKHSAKKDAGAEETFGAAIRRFSQRKKKQMAPRSARRSDDNEEATTKCGSLTPASLVDRFRQWRRRGSRSCDDVRI